MHADSAYSIANHEETILKNKMNNEVHEKAKRGQALTAEQKKSNTEKSRITARVEHIIGFMAMIKNAMHLYCTGFKRTNANVGLMDMTYNMFRKI